MQEQSESAMVYGVHPVTELVRNRPAEIEKVYFLEGRGSGALFSLLKEVRRLRLPYQVVPELRLDKLAPGARHQGVLAICAAKKYAEFDEVLAALGQPGSAGLILIPASIEDPRNLGSIIRSAVAFGVDAILLERGNTAPLSDSASKSSAGMLEHAVICRPRSLEAAVGELRSRGFKVVGAEASADKVPSAVDMTGPLVLVLGGEHRGLPPYLAKQCDARVGIPLDPRVESLNVSAAASVLLYECRRQRGR